MSASTYLKPSQPGVYNLYGLQAIRFVAAITNKKLLCMLQLEPSSLWLLMLHSGIALHCPHLLRLYLLLVYKDVQFLGII